MPSIFESFLRGQQAAQAQALNQLKLQQAQQIDPIQQQLQQLELQRGQQQLAAGQKRQELAQQQQDTRNTITIGALADQALRAEDEETKRAIVEAGFARFGVEGDPSQVTDLDLRALSAQGRAARGDQSPTEFQERNLALQQQRLDLEKQRLSQADDRLGLQANKLETSINTALQQALAEAKARGATLGKGEATQLIDAPQSIEIASNTIGTIDSLLNHPGIDRALGFEGVINPINYTPGTDEYDFALKLEQLQGKAFLQAFESLKGGGQITEVEGKKATDAIAQLSRKQSPEQFRKSVNELRDIADRARLKAERKLGKEPAPESLDPDLLKFMTAEERALFE